MVIIFVSEKQLHRLKKDLSSTRRQAYAEGTHKNLKIQWETYLMFCIHFGLKYLPVNTNTLSLYAQFLSNSFKSTQSIKNYLSGVKTIHFLLGYTTDKINEFVVNLGLRGLARSKPHMPKQAQAITPEILLKMYALLDMKKRKDIVYWCLFVFAFFMFARKSNLVPTTFADLKKPKFLLRRDVTRIGDILLVTMKWSKTNQFGARVLQIPLIKIPHSPLCPISAYKNMCSMVSAEETDPLFTLPNGVPIFYKEYQTKLKQLIHNIGMNSDDFSTHSLRRGGCSYAFTSKVPTELIKAHGDWKSDCYQQYLSFSLEDKLLVVGRMRENIKSNMQSLT